MGEMVKDPNCAYCVEGELLAKFGYPCCEMKTGKLYVFKEQSKRGRVILAHKKHVSELIELMKREMTILQMLQKLPEPSTKYLTLIR